MRQLLLTICSLCYLVTWGQDFYPPIVNYSLKEYGTTRNPENYSIVQDERGVMYFANSHGILEFDGENWSFIQVGFGSFVRSLNIDKSGVIYVGIYGDFGFLAPNEKGKLYFKSLADRLPEEERNFSNVWRIHATSKAVFFQTEEALFEYNLKSGNLKTISSETTFHTSFLIDSTLYIRQREIGLVAYENGQITHLKGTEIFANFGVFGMHKLPDDSLLIVTQELGFYKWYNGGMRELLDSTEHTLNELGIIGSFLLSDGDIALNTLTNGLVIVNVNGEIRRKIDRSVGIRSNTVQFIHQDRDLNLWLALENGISKVNYHSPLSYFTDKAGVEGDVQAIVRFKGNIYVGTSTGLFMKDNDVHGVRCFVNKGIINGKVWDFQIVGEKLIIGSDNGIFTTLDGNAFKRVALEQTNAIAYRPMRNDFITGGPNGIIVYDSQFKEKWSYLNSFSTFIGAEVDPQNDSIIWLGTSKSGACRLKESSGEEFQVDIYGDFDGLLDNLGKPMIYEDSLIFGAKDGLFTFINEDMMREELKDELTAEQLADPLFVKGMFVKFELYDSLFNGQFLLLEKGKERTWYCNEFKIGYYDHATHEFKNRPFWGINSGRINQFYLEEDGVLWIGSAEGLIRYEKNNLKKYDSDFHSLIRQFSIIQGDTLFNGAFVGDSGIVTLYQDEGKILELDYINNDIEILFSAPYFEDEHKPEYRYILEGNDNEWSDWGSKSSASYNNLHEGDYTFRVEARNIYGQISQQATYSFVILPPWYRTTWAFILYGIGFVLVLLLGIRISSKRLKAKNLWLESVIEERTKEISQKNVVLEHQKQEIQDSINYAQRIQEAILPLEEEMKRWIPKSFILFRPKDIVSGDFYWFLERDNKLIIICADCTGHGVPGAFMSMIGSDRLNNIVSENKITDPSAILSELNRAIKKSLKQDGQKNTTRDGMDAAICTIDLTTNVLKYAGANRALWIVDAAATNLNEIKATKVAVAGFTPDNQEYEEHEIALVPGLKFYLTTDGYADQFGSERNKKFKIANLKDLLVKNALKPFHVQKEILENELVAWMGDFEQVDDVCVLGFEFQPPI